MAFYHRIPIKYLRLIPAWYFMLLGIVYLVGDFRSHSLSWLSWCVVILFSMPLIINHRLVFTIAGTVIAMIFVYFGVAIMRFLFSYFNGIPIKHAFELFAVGIPFVTMSFIFSLSLVQVGIRYSKNENIA